MQSHLSLNLTNVPLTFTFCHWLSLKEDCDLILNIISGVNWPSGAVLWRFNTVMILVRGRFRKYLACLSLYIIKSNDVPETKSGTPYCPVFRNRAKILIIDRCSRLVLMMMLIKSRCILKKKRDKFFGYLYFSLVTFKPTNFFWISN